MTLSSTTVKLSYNGDGSTTSFSVAFTFWDNSDIRVILRDSAGAETVWTEATQYNLTGGDGSTGTVTVITAPSDYTPASGEKLIIKSNLAETQGDELPLSGAFPSTTVEQMVDQTVRMVQQHTETLARAILLSETSALSGLELPDPGASELIRYNAAGTSLETVALASLSTSLDTLFSGLAAEDFLKYDGTNWVNRTPANVRTDLGLGIVRKTGDETVNNSTTLQDDDDLVMSLAANEIVSFRGYIRFNSNTTADFKYAFTVPSGATVAHAIGPSQIETQGSGTPNTGISGTGSDKMLTIFGFVANGSNAGNLQLQWAQDTADVSDTKVLINSFILAWRV